MKAAIRPLRGKYYGTRIVLDDGGGIDVWYMGDGTPSWREMEDGEGPEMCDSHYETQQGLRIAEAIVEALMGLPF